MLLRTNVRPPRRTSNVKVGVTLKMYEYGSYRAKSLADVAEQARRAEDAGFDSAWVMDHAFIARPGGRVVAHDPLIALAAAAAATSRLGLGSMALCHAFRHPGQLAREASALADLSRGRFVLGLGAGWHQPEFAAFGLPFDHRVGRLEESLGPLRGLLGGGRVSLAGNWVTLDEASVATTTGPPPVWIAGAGPRMIALAATADGWNHSYWGAADTQPFETALGVFNEGLVKAGRPRDQVTVSASVACVPGGWDEVAGGFREPEVAIGSNQEIADIVRSYADAGAEHVILSLSPDPYAELRPDLLERAKELLDLL